ncbi:hypothetical protein [Thalassotalea agarivorans]|uniref:Outer membrane protein beta-barrel domain-containing protein n=1 Tax=Thalassotalea agarivorans TaxID=349064 RepID=A0A1I0AFL2_THASX|nr:hypothetical protein [Thalassotalea agarivorans]SES92038.1 hypothetical protein SAMN05660429_00661 [Thalassotalea agarivorans]
MKQTAIFFLAYFVCSASTYAKYHFAYGLGSTFIFMPEISYSIDENSNIFAQYRWGMTKGYAIGWERKFHDNFSASLLYGTVGSDAKPCEASDSGILVDTAVCAANTFLTRNAANGFGTSFNYYFSGYDHGGFILKGELGYGENTVLNEYDVKTGIYLFYKF